MFSSSHAAGDVVPQTVRVIKHNLEREVCVKRSENILQNQFIVFNNILHGTISKLFLAYRTKYNFKTIPAYGMTCTVFVIVSL